MERREKIRCQAYRGVLASDHGKAVLDDLVCFAQASDVTEARALGRADVVLRFLRENKRAGEIKQEDDKE